MRYPRWLRAGLAVTLLSPMLPGVTRPGPVEAASPTGLTASPVPVSSRHTAGRAPTSRLARTEPALLGRTDDERVPVLVKLDSDPLATYAGGVPGLAATSPTATGRELTDTPARRRYEDYLAGRERAFAATLARRVPGATVTRGLRVVYGGVAALVPANRIRDVLAIEGVVAVQRDELRRPLTDVSPHVIGADQLDTGAGGARDAGRGVIVGLLDSGVWPEHPSLADQGHLSAPPGPARVCDFGDNPLTPTVDVFACNNKLISGRPFLDAYNALVGGGRYADSARDGVGHGTHTATTAAGDVLPSARLSGVERGPVRGIAPGAWVSVYKVCGAEGCFSSDSTAAVGQAVLDGVDVINFSVSGGRDPFTDAVELAFLDAYAAGVFVATSAGNDGQSASVEHTAPWVTTVAATSPPREFSSTLTLTSGSGRLVLTGASTSGGVGAPAPVVPASAAPYGDPLCLRPVPAGLFRGRIVACRQGGGSAVTKGYHLARDGAVGMILYNPTPGETDPANHWLPTVHLADGGRLLDWLRRHDRTTATFTAGARATGQGDRVAPFSARGPGGPGIKPDLAAPGVRILAGHTPTPEGVGAGPPGQDFQVLSGTSMAAPHVTGAAALLKARHPAWTPGQIKSALLTTATTENVPGDPFDRGSGRVDVSRAAAPGLTFDETAARLRALGDDPVNAVHLNLPSVYAPVMPGRLSTVRTAKNVTGESQTYRVTTTAPEQSRIMVLPASFTVKPGGSVDMTVTITSNAPGGQLFGEITLDAERAGVPTSHLPVAFTPQQGEVGLRAACRPAAIHWRTTSTCTVTATNGSLDATTVDLTSTTSPNLPVGAATGGTRTSPFRVERNGVRLSAVVPGAPSLRAVPVGRYRSLAGLGVPAEPVGDEEIVNFEVPRFAYGGRSYTGVGVTSNGYLVVGGGTARDVRYEPEATPGPARPNNVLAPFWTDLTGRGAEGLRVATVADLSGARWLVVEWRLNMFGTDSGRHFQVWLGLGDTEKIFFGYDPAAPPVPPVGRPTMIGAENADGSGGARLPEGVVPRADLQVTSVGAVPGGSVSYSLEVTGAVPGPGQLTSTLTAAGGLGTIVVTTPVEVSYPR